MDDDDFLSLIDFLKNHLVVRGFGDIARDENYISTPEDGEAEGSREPDAEALPTPKEHLLMLLSELARDLTLRNYRTFENSLNNISELIDGPGPHSVSIELPVRRGSERINTIQLNERPNYDEIISDIYTLIAALRGPSPAPDSAPRPPPGPAPGM